MTIDTTARPPGEASAVATSGDSVRIERLLPGPVERVWAYLTESERRAEWLAAGPMDLRVGGEVELAFRHGELSHEPTPERWRDVDGHVLRGRVTRCGPPRLLAFTWPEAGGLESEVTFELMPVGDSVRLVVTHRRLRDLELMVDVASGWHAHLGILIDHLEDREPRGFWSLHERLMEEHGRRLGGEKGGPDDG
jgi:uncharacterized protein YndB with AHSA1/START domain